MDLMTLLETCRTYRRFDQYKKIPSEVIEEILAAQRFASSACNQQRLRYLVVKTPELVEKVFPFTKWAASLPPEIGTPKEGEHPTLFILVLYDRRKKNKWIDTDAGLAISNMTLAAWNHGVGSCIMDNVDRTKLRQVLELNETLEIHSVIAFGYPSHHSTVVAAEDEKKLGYYLDVNRDYYVPKLPVDATTTFL